MKNKILFAIFAAVLFLITAFAASAQMFTITSTPATTATVGNQYLYQMATNITDVTYGIVSGPSEFSVAPTTGLFMWTPSSTGSFAINLSATGNESDVEYQAFTIVVSEDDSSDKMLEIDEIQVKVDGSKDTLSSEGTVDDEAKLGDDIEMKVTVKNNFKVQNSSTIIRDIELKVSSDLDDADDLDESMSRLEAGDDDDVTFSFTMDAEDIDPSDAPFDITIKVTGETSDGTSYEDSWTIKLDMDSKSRDLMILNAEVAPLTVSSCSSSKMRVNVGIRNIGSKDLDDAAVRMKVSDLGISEIISDIELDSGDDDEYSGYVTIPANTAAGTYDLDISAYPQKTINTMTSMVTYSFKVLECTTGNTQTSTNTSNNGNVNTNTGSNAGTVIIPNVEVSGTPVSSAVGNKGLFNSDNVLYLVLLGVLIVLLATVIILLVVKIKN